jgi:hypothetical protein
VGRKNENKTQTIFKRRIAVYAPTLGTKARWEQEAEKRGQSVSDMVFQLVEGKLAGDGEDIAAKTQSLQRQVGDLTNEIATLRSRTQQLETLNERLEKDLREYRADVFLEEVPAKQLDRQLVHILSSSKGTNGLARPVGDEELVKSMKIGVRDEKRLKALNQNLIILEQFQLIKKVRQGWVWNA